MSGDLRQTGVLAYRRFVVETMVSALRNVFTGDYDRDRQFESLKITQQYPLKKIDYPSIVLEYVDRKVVNAGVGHIEWFNDNDNILRQWMHSRFEGTLNLNVYGLSPLDRDLLADALVEVIRFGRLDSQLVNLFDTIYGDPDANYSLQFGQIMFNSDELYGKGNSATLAPWQPEDSLVYSTGYSIELHGGFYNTVITDTFEYVSDVAVSSYPEGEVQAIIAQADEPTFTNPLYNADVGTVVGTGEPSGTDSLD